MHFPKKPKTAPNFNRNIIFWSFLLRVAESDFGKVILRHWVLPFAETSSPKPKKSPALAACPCRPPGAEDVCCSIHRTRWSTTCPKTIQRSKVRASTFSGDFGVSRCPMSRDFFTLRCWWILHDWHRLHFLQLGMLIALLCDRPIQVVWNIYWLYLHYVESSSGWNHVSFWIGACWNLSRIHLVWFRAYHIKMITFFGVVASKLRYIQFGLLFSFE